MTSVSRLRVCAKQCGRYETANALETEMYKTRREAFGSICPSSVEAVKTQVAANEPNNLAKNTHDIPEKRSNRGSPEATFCLTNLQLTTCPFTTTTQRVFDKLIPPSHLLSNLSRRKFTDLATLSC